VLCCAVLCCVAQAERGTPLLQLSAAQLAPISQLKQAMQAAAAAAPRNDHCETCKVSSNTQLQHQQKLAEGSMFSSSLFYLLFSSWHVVHLCVVLWYPCAVTPLLPLTILPCCAVLCPLQVVVMEMRQLVANPELQVQLIDYAKQACAVFPSFQPTCEADVDQYAPMVFGMMLAYLQPDQVGGEGGGGGGGEEGGRGGWQCLCMCIWGPGASRSLAVSDGVLCNRTARAGRHIAVMTVMCVSVANTDWLQRC